MGSAASAVAVAELAKRQNTVTKLEQKVANRQQANRLYTQKVAASAKKFEAKVLQKEQKQALEATKRIHDANFAMEQMSRRVQSMSNSKNEALLKASRLREALTKAVANKLAVRKAASAGIRQLRREESLSTSSKVRHLRLVAQKRIHAMALASQQVMSRELATKKTNKIEETKV